MIQHAIVFCPSSSINQRPPSNWLSDSVFLLERLGIICKFWKGPDWHKFWNPKMRDLLIDMQDKSGDDAKRGSWQKDMGHIGSQCGRLGTTCLALLTLEVYYRHLPLYKRDSGGLADLEKQ